MDKKVLEVIDKIKKDNLAQALKDCRDIREKQFKLMELFPGAWLWDPMSARQLVYCLQKKFGIEFGVCEFYRIRKDRQYCLSDGTETECLCAIPEPYCVFRDKDKKPKYPEFFPIRIIEHDQEEKDALRILGNCARGAAE